jgi:hypothetical protein
VCPLQAHARSLTLILWHVAGALFLFRWVFRDPSVDARFLVAGVLLPDLVDLTVGTVLVPALGSGQLWLHTLMAPSVVVIVVLVATRRGARRRAWMALAVGMFFHLLLDGMWTSTEVFLWPLFGLDFPAGETPYWPAAWERALDDPWRWAKEAVGLAYLIGLWKASGLAEPAARADLLRTGRLSGPPPSAQSSLP